MDSIVELPALSTEEDTFALAVIEYGGNLGAAYRAAFGENATLPVAKAKELLTRPEVAKRVHELTIITEESALISLGSHLVELANIRDLSKENKQFKVALDAEKARGEAVGIGGKQGPINPVQQGPMVQIFMGASSGNVADWAAKHGQAPVVVDMPK